MYPLFSCILHPSYIHGYLWEAPCPCWSAKDSTGEHEICLENPEKKWKNYDKTFHKMNYFKSFSPGSTYAALMWPRLMYQPLPGHRFSLIWKLYKRNENKKFTKSFSSHSSSPASEAVGDHPCSCSQPVSQPSIQWAAIYLDLWTTLEFTPRAQSLEKLHRPNTAHISTANAELSQIFAYPKGMTRGWNALPYQESPKN